MTRMSKQGKKRAVSPRKNKKPSVKTGPKEEKGFKAHKNAVQGDQLEIFISKVK
jgi:hypothetical protein